MRKAIVLSILLAGFAVHSLGQTPQHNQAEWAQWQFLIGDWIGEGGGKPGQASGGGTTFSFDLQNHILIRRSFSDYPATKERPSIAHRDLMVIYRDPETKGFRAIYWDNEDHVISYTASFSADGETVTLTSAPSSTSPRYRLIYRKKAADRVGVEFDIAPPGKPDSFSKYAEGTLHRR